MSDFINEDTNNIEQLDVMEPRLLVNHELKVIYINEAFEEALEDKNSPQQQEYARAEEENPDYPTRLRRIPITIEFMKRYARITKDRFMQDLIKRQEPTLRQTGEVYDVSSFFAFKNMFLAKNPQCKNVYKTIKKMDKYESEHPEIIEDKQA